MNNLGIKEWTRQNLSKTPPKGSLLKVGDWVEWENDYGVKWKHQVIGFNTDMWYNEKYKAFVHLNNEAYWFPHKEETLTKID